MGVSISQLNVFMSDLAAGSEAASWIPSRPPSSDYSSSRAFKVARGWMDECAEKHSCSTSTENAPFLPRRLIDVSIPDTTDTLQLYETAGKTSSISYCTLSYCWGAPTKHTQDPTTTLNLQQRLLGFSLRQLPQTIQDAVFVTQALGVQYLWVDALCIVQDDIRDKEDQIYVMGDIYAHACLAILASSTSGCADGFLQNRLQRYFSIPYGLPDGTLSSVMLAEILRQEEEPLSERGWVLQEQYFSDCMVIFSSTQPYWICRQKLSCLDPAVGFPPEYYFRNSTRGNELVWLTRPKTTWVDIVQDYSRRLLSNPEDKLPAIASIARAFMEQEGGGANLAGLSSATFDQNLTWIASDGRAAPWPSTSSRPPIPSWSWASRKGRVRYIVWLEHERRFVPRLLPATNLVGAIERDRFGNITAGCVRLRGLLKYLVTPPSKTFGLRRLEQGVPAFADHIWDAEAGRYRKPANFNPDGTHFLNTQFRYGKDYFGNIHLDDDWEMAISLSTPSFNEVDFTVPPVIWPVLLLGEWRETRYESDESVEHDCCGLVLDQLRPKEQQTRTEEGVLRLGPCRRAGVFYGYYGSSWYFNNGIECEVELR